MRGKQMETTAPRLGVYQWPTDTTGGSLDMRAGTMRTLRSTLNVGDDPVGQLQPRRAIRPQGRS
jgi:hypothetical protein